MEDKVKNKRSKIGKPLSLAAALKASEIRYRRLFESASDGILILDAEAGTVIEANPSLIEMLGFSQKELLVKKIWELGFLKDTLANKNKFAELQRKGYIRYENLPIETADGRQIEVEFVSSVYEVAHQKVIQCNIRDITERRRAQEALTRVNIELEAVNKELESFSYSVSHDLRAPLRGIDGFSQALLEDCADKLNGQGRDHVRRVRSAAQRMGELIDDLLALSRVTRSEMKQEMVDLSAIAQSIAAGLRETEPKRQVEFVIAEGLTVKGDAVLLRTVLENLLGNAWKFTGKQPKARIEFGVTRNEGKPAYFVRDDGVGFDMTYVGKLFAPFQRLHAVGEFPGTGIGLATVQRIIHRHGGRVWAEGRVGEGATFYFTLG